MSRSNALPLAALMVVRADAVHVQKSNTAALRRCAGEHSFRLNGSIWFFLTPPFKLHIRGISPRETESDAHPRWNVARLYSSVIVRAYVRTCGRSKQVLRMLFFPRSN